jgi:drug/metabolite transporter (DMT)-like permease
MRTTSVAVESSRARSHRWLGAVSSYAADHLARRAQALAFGAVYLVWGSTYLGIRVGVESIPPFTLAAARALVAGAILFAWARLRGAPSASTADWLRASVAGGLMLAGGNGLVTWAETRVSSSLAALLIALVPSYVTLLEWSRPGGARPTRADGAGVAIGMLGMLLLVRPGAGTARAGHWEGVAALGVGGLCWALGSLYSRYQPTHPSRTLSAAMQMLAGGLALAVAAAMQGELATFHVSAVTDRSLLALVYLTLFGSLVAFSAFNWLIGVTTPARLSTTAYVNPLVALLLGWVVLGESLHPVSLAGALLIVGAVALMARAARPKSSLPASPSTAPPLTPPSADQVSREGRIER